MYCTLNLSATTYSYKKHLTSALHPTEAKTMTTRTVVFHFGGYKA